jgi:hypothetical protein
MRLRQDGEMGAQAPEGGRLRDAVARVGAVPAERPRAVFNPKNLEQDLARLLRGGNPEQHRDVLDRPLAASALAGAPG